MNKTEEKYIRLVEYLKSLGKVAIAFSGGVDSTLLLYAAREALGDNVMAITARASAFPDREHLEAEEFCSFYNIKQVVIDFDQLAVPGFAENPTDRCYICKKILFSQFVRAARENGMDILCEGSNMSDSGDYRPGMRAIEELGVKSPLKVAELDKSEIRQLLVSRNLTAGEKPSFACLATRIPYGEKITEEKLTMIGKAEQLLIDLGFRQVRVRAHDRLARIEVLPEDIERLASEEIGAQVTERLKEYGFTYVSLDLAGYRTGSMNAGVK